MPTATRSVLIEVGEEAVGVLVAGERGFTLHVVHHALAHLNGAVFPSVQAAQTIAQADLKERTRKAG